MNRLALLVLLGAAAHGCRQRTFAPVADAATDAVGSDGPAPLTLDMAITGCASYVPATTESVARCTGTAPLVLSLSPVGSPDFTRFKWTYGDGTPIGMNRAPMHTYALPGSYQISLIGVLPDPGGTVGSTALVMVEPVAAGAPCDVDAQCGDGLRCACAPGTGCPPAFTRGLCSTACDSGFCGPGAVCAALALEPSSDGGAPPRLPACVAACQANPDCAPGFGCEVLPTAGSSNPSAWTHGCVPIGALADLGAPCRDATGTLDDGACATGTCADLGALGLCSAPCDASHACPDGTGCARFGDGRQLCLVACASPDTCGARDPLLACVTATAADAGVTGFQLAGPTMSGADYCAPKPCASDADCAPAGRCGPGGACIAS